MRRAAPIIMVLVLATLACSSINSDHGGDGIVGPQSSRQPTVPRTPTPTSGPLKVSSTNSRYFKDSDGNIVWLAGSNYWNLVQDGGRTNPPPAFDFDEFVNFAVAHGLNHIEFYAWEHYWHKSDSKDWYMRYAPFARTGPGTALDGNPKFDLETFDSNFFDRVRARVIKANQNGLYVTINFFHGFSTRSSGNTMTDLWLGNPFHPSNNINGIDGDPTNTGEGKDVNTLNIPQITAIQEAYVKHLIDTLNDLDNVIWQIAEETDGTYSRNGHDSEEWQEYFLDFIHTYEATKDKQHPVLYTVQWPGGNNNELLASNAEAIAPNGDNGYGDPKAIDGTKVVIIDTDHIEWTSVDEQWPWRSLTRGAGGFWIMDGGYSNYDDQEGGVSYNDAESIRYNAGDALTLSQLADIQHMQPQNEGTYPSDTGYCLYPVSSSYHEYIVFQPSNNDITLDLSGESGTFIIQKINLADDSINTSQMITGGAVRTITQPSSWTSGWTAWVYPFTPTPSGAFYLPIISKE